MTPQGNYSSSISFVIRERLLTATPVPLPSCLWQERRMSTERQQRRSNTRLLRRRVQPEPSCAGAGVSRTGLPRPWEPPVKTMEGAGGGRAVALPRPGGPGGGEAAWCGRAAARRGRRDSAAPTWPPRITSPAPRGDEPRHRAAGGSRGWQALHPRIQPPHLGQPEAPAPRVTRAAPSSPRQNSSPSDPCTSHRNPADPRTASRSANGYRSSLQIVRTKKRRFHSSFTSCVLTDYSPRMTKASSPGFTRATRTAATEAHTLNLSEGWALSANSTRSAPSALP